MGNNVVIGGTILQRIPSCLSVLDKFLNLDEAVVSSLVKVDGDDDNGAAKSGADLIKSILNILGLKNADSIDPKSTLGELGLDSLMQVEVKQRLERDYGLNYTAHQIRELTLQDLKDISETKSPGGGDGAGAQGSGDGLVIDVQIDEWLKSFKSPEIPLKLNQVEGPRPWFVFPPIEGSFSPIKPIIEKLQAPAIGLCWNETIHSMGKMTDMIATYARIIKELQPSGPYDIMGYSAGTSVAFYVAQHLRRMGDSVDNLILLDSTHKLFEVRSDQAAEGLGGDEAAGGTNPMDLALEVECFLTFTRLFGITSSANQDQLTALKDRLTSAPNTEKRLEMFVQILRASHESLSEEMIQNMKTAILVCLHKTKILGHPNFNGAYPKKYPGSVTLLRSSEGVFQSAIKDTGEDYGLSDCVDGTCNVITLPGDHLSFLQQNADQISNLINGASSSS